MEDRSAIEITVTVAGETVRILTTHLAHEGNAPRVHQAEEMVQWMDEGGNRNVPMIIMGDFNARRQSEPMSFYENAGFEYAVTGNVYGGVDHILYRPIDRWEVIESTVHTQYTASDHDAVSAVLELQDPGVITVTQPLTGNFSFSIIGQGLIYSGYPDISRIKIMDLSGNRIKTIPVHSSNVIWDRTDYKGNAVSSGIYIVRLISDSWVNSIKTVLLP